MKAKMEVTVKYTICQEFEYTERLIKAREVAEIGARELCDILSDQNAAVGYEVLDSKIDVHV